MYVRVEGVRGQGTRFCSDECRKERKLAGARTRSSAFRERLPVDERARRRRVALLAKYGLTPESFDAMVQAQGGVCAICRRPEEKHHSLLLKVDHDRTCCAGHQSCGRCVRGLLCSNCNRAIGLLGDDHAVAESAASYLRKASLD